MRARGLGSALENVTGLNKLGAILGLAAFLLAATSHTFGLLLPIHATSTNVLDPEDTASLGMLFTTYSIVLVIFTLPSGVLVDRVGRKPLAVLGLGGLAASSFLYPMAASFSQLIAVRVLEAAATALAGVVLVTMLTDVVDPSHRGRAMGTYNLLSTLGVVVTVVAGIVRDLYGAGAVFYGLAAWVVLSTLLVAVLVPEARRGGSDIGSGRGERTSTDEIQAKGTKTRSLGLPVIVICATYFLVQMGNAVIYPLTSSFLMRFGVGAGLLFLGFSVFSLGTLLLQMPMSYLSDRMKKKNLVVAAILVYSVPTLMIGSADSISGFGAARFLQGALSTGIGPILLAMLGDLTIKESRGRAMSLYRLSFNLGWMVGPLIGGFLAESYGLLMPFIVCSSMMWVGAVVFYALIRS